LQFHETSVFIKPHINAVDNLSMESLGDASGKMKGKKMKAFLNAFLLLVMVLTCGHALAATVDDDATAAVTCTVDGLMEWAGNFPALTLANITAQGTVVTTSGTATLYTNGDVHITADTSTAAQLTRVTGTDVLVTEYRLEYDGDGDPATGGATVDYLEYDAFLVTPSVVTHAAGDGAVVVTLRVRASNEAGEVADAGNYAATQTLTASWGTGL
jgi:hypothetical protein